MKAMLNVLERAQKLLLGDQHGPGWTGPESSFGFCLRQRGDVDSRGRKFLVPCWWDDEAVWQYTVDGALRIASNGNQELFDATWEALRAVVAPSWVGEDAFHATLPPLPKVGVTPEVLAQWRMWSTLVAVALRQQDLREWLRAPERQLTEVLNQFDQVILKLKGAQLQ